MKNPTRYEKNNNIYMIGTWGVDKSLEVLVWLTKNFGEGFVSIFMSEDKEAVGKAIDEGNAGSDETKVIEEFVSKIVDRLEPREYTKYARIICEGTKRNGRDIVFNEDFRGAMGELHFLMFHILRHQYGDFLEGSGSED